MSVYRTFNQQQLDAQYNVRAGIPDHLDIFARWEEAGRAFRREHHVLENLAYGEGDKQSLDLFQAKRPNRPLLVFIHGGYWQSLDKSDFSCLAGPYLDEDVNVAVINYRLAPAVRMGDIVADNRAAVLWLYRNAARLAVDPDRIFVSGHSAGGHLTATMAGTDWAAFDAPTNLLKGACAISGLYDLEPIRLCYLNKVVDLTPQDVAAYSPTLHLPTSDLPFILTVGGNESAEYHRLQSEYTDLLRAQGRTVRIVNQRGGHHFDAVERLGDCDGELSAAVLQMIHAAG